MDLPQGVTSHTIETDRLRVHYLESGPEDGIPVLLIHGNLSTARFYEHILPGAPMRGQAPNRELKNVMMP